MAIFLRTGALSRLKLAADARTGRIAGVVADVDGMAREVLTRTAANLWEWGCDWCDLGECQRSATRWPSERTWILTAETPTGAALQVAGLQDQPRERCAPDPAAFLQVAPHRPAEK